jgi:predicted secreted protein
MAAGAGRDMRWKYNSGAGAVVVAGARSDNLTFNRGMIDITDKDDSGIRTLLDEIGTFSVSGGVNGVLKGTQLLSLIDSTAATHLLDLEFDIIGLGSVAGEFMITSFELGGDDGENPATFSCNVESSGPVPFTAA